MKLPRLTARTTRALLCGAALLTAIGAASADQGDKDRDRDRDDQSKHSLPVSGTMVFAGLAIAAAALVASRARKRS